MKRILDIAVSLLALVLFSPLIVLCALAVVIDSGRPIFFSQTRIGRGFRPFRIWKLRSMRVDQSGPAVTVGGDSRLTRAGKFLRAAKLDELPQLWNVLRGDMSLVGPRPELPEYVEMYRERYQTLLTVRPGITDLATVRYRDEETALAAASDPMALYAERILPAKLDISDEYMRSRSMALDLSILWQTLRVVLHNPASVRRSPATVLENIGLRRLIRLLRRARRWRLSMVWLTEIGIFALSGVLSFFLRLDFILGKPDVRCLEWALAIWIPVKVLTFRLTGLDHGWGRFVSIPDLSLIAFGNLAASVVGGLLIKISEPPGFPRSIFAIDFLLCFLGTAGARVFIRVVAEVNSQERQAESGPRTLIYGAGFAGDLLLRELRANSRLPYRIVGFVDDGPAKKGIRIQGVPVLGSGSNLEALCQEMGIQKVLIAIPSATGRQLTRILGLCSLAGVRCETVPGLGDILTSGALTGKIREVDVEDLMGGRPVDVDEESIRAHIEGRTVLITGAAGSVGSELCRRIARFAPERIVGFEIAESPLFFLEREMRAAFPQVPFHPIVGNIQNQEGLSQAVQRFGPSLVFHCAAYKHVPMMEENVFEALDNNLFGTLNAARAAMNRRVERFVLVSSDKAVRPASIMGATARLAELAVNSMQNHRTDFLSVRFGALLESSGSVIPVFKRQIEAGGPITVTHPEMRRFFMTIPEAVRLLLQAAVIGNGGEILALDMGEPVKIVDLATDLILLSGLRPGEDITIEFTGIRPGEKLYEEPTAHEKSVVPTSHERIKRLPAPPPSQERIRGGLIELEAIRSARDMRRLIPLLKELVPEYDPSPQILEEAFRGGMDMAIGAKIPEGGLRGAESAVSSAARV